MEAFLLLLGALIGLWILWKMRRVFWFLLLFLGALAVLLIINGDIGLGRDYEWVGPALGFILIISTAFKFAKERSK